MLDSFKQKIVASSQHNLNTIIKQLTQAALVHNLSNANMQQLTKIVQGKINGYKIHSKVMTTIYSIIIMKGYTNYNTKMAIQNLSKYYRTLMPTQNNQNTNQQIIQDNNIVSKKTRIVIANLLIRIPTFSNYKLILKDLSPQLLPSSVVLQHRDKIYKQCPNIYKDYLIKTHKYVWYQLMQNDQQNFPLHSQFKQLRVQFQTIIQTNNIINLYKIYQGIQKQIKYIKNLLENTIKQQIDIQQTCNEIKNILTYNINVEKQRKLLMPQIISKQQQYIKNTKKFTLQLLRMIVNKLKFQLFRKFKWMINLIQQLTNRTYDSVSIQPAYLISFYTTLLQNYGIGFINFDQFVHNQQQTSLFSLISALAYNDYSKNNKNQTQLVNYQTKSKNNKNKTNIYINLYSTTVVDTPYEFYLKKTNQYQREFLMWRILQFLQLYYENKLKNSKQFFYSSEILGILGTSKNQISKRNKQLIQKIKNQILFKGFKQIGEHFESFCENVFNTYIKRRKQRKLSIHRIQQLFIQPTIVNPEAQAKKSHIGQSYVSFTSKQVFNNSSQKNQLRKTNSFDMELQGWSHHQKAQRSQGKLDKSKSQMFYSIKQCSPIQEKDEGKLSKQEENNEEEKQFILTPQF